MVGTGRTAAATSATASSGVAMTRTSTPAAAPARSSLRPRRPTTSQPAAAEGRGQRTSGPAGADEPYGAHRILLRRSSPFAGCRSPSVIEECRRSQHTQSDNLPTSPGQRVRRRPARGPGRPAGRARTAAPTSGGGAPAGRARPPPRPRPAGRRRRGCAGRGGRPGPGRPPLELPAAGQQPAGASAVRSSTTRFRYGLLAVGTAHRLGLVERGDGHHVAAGPQRGHRLGQVAPGGRRGWSPGRRRPGRVRSTAVPGAIAEGGRLTGPAADHPDPDRADVEGDRGAELADGHRHRRRPGRRIEQGGGHRVGQRLEQRKRRPVTTPAARSAIAP